MRGVRRRRVTLLGLIVLGVGLAFWWASREVAPGPDGETAGGLAVDPEPESLPKPARRRSRGSSRVEETSVPAPAEPAPETEPDVAPKAPHVYALVVTVRDRDDLPVHGARVTLSDFAPLHELRGAPPSGETFVNDDTDWEDPDSEPTAPFVPISSTTDGGGSARFELAQEHVHITVESDNGVGQVAPLRLSASEVTQVDVRLRPAFRMSGVARRPNGDPVAGGMVWVAAPVPGAAPRHLKQTTTDEAGRFSFPLLALPGTRNLRIYVMGPNEPGTAIEIPAVAGVIDDVVVVLPPATVVRGRCVDELGKPLGGVRVRGYLPPTGEITYTSGKGGFSMKVPSSGGGLLFWTAGRVQTLLRDLHGPPEGVDVGDVVIPKGGVISGRVLNRSGKPLSGHRLAIHDPSTHHHSHEQELGPTGTFHSDVIGPGAHVLMVRGNHVAGDGDVPCWYQFEPHFAGSTGIELVVPDAVTALVDLHDVDGRPVAFGSGTVHVWRPGGTKIAAHRVFSDGDPVTALDVQFPEPGTYEIVVRWADSPLSAQATVTVSGEEGQNFRLLAR